MITFSLIIHDTSKIKVASKEILFLEVVRKHFIAVLICPSKMRKLNIFMVDSALVIERRRVQLRINLNELFPNKKIHESYGRVKFFVWKQRIQINP